MTVILKVVQIYTSSMEVTKSTEGLYHQTNLFTKILTPGCVLTVTYMCFLSVIGASNSSMSTPSFSCDNYRNLGSPPRIYFEVPSVTLTVFHSRLYEELLFSSSSRNQEQLSIIAIIVCTCLQAFVRVTLKYYYINCYCSDPLIRLFIGNQFTISMHLMWPL